MQMMNNPLISILVPIYKSEKYIEKCIESVINQTYRNIELVLVDDGSPDNSGQICDEYAKKDNRIVVVHQANGGVSDARNRGLETANGSIISFVDPDDWYELDTIESMYKKMCEDGSDLVCCGVKYIDENDNIIRISTAVEKDECLNTEDAMNEFLGYRKVKQQIWDKMYRRETIGDIRFEKGRSIEDVFWVHQIIGNASKITIMNKPLYNYMQRSDSVMGTGYTVKWMDILDALQQRCQYIEQRFPTLYIKSLRLYLGTCMYHLQLAIKSNQNKKTCDSIIGHISFYKDIVKKKSLIIRFGSFQQNVWMRLFLHYPILTCKFRNKMKKGL